MAPRTRSARRLTATTLALALVAAACGDRGGPEAGPDPSPTEQRATDTVVEAAPTEPAGYCDPGVERELVWVHRQEPPDLHLHDPDNNLSITSWIRQSVWEGLYGVSERTTFIPELLAHEAVVEEHEDGSVRIDFTLRDDLRWSDGTDLTAEHVRGTFEIIMEGHDPETGEGGRYRIGDRSGYGLITSFAVHSDTAFTIEMSDFLPNFESLFSEVFPTHVVATAAEANVAFRAFEHDGATLPASGPMVLERWLRGRSLTLARNDAYHGSTSPDVRNRGAACVSGVRIDWLPDAAAQVEALRSGAGDLVFTDVQPDLAAELATDDDITVASSPGRLFEHWGLNLHNRHLRKPEVRAALAHALDKAEVVAELYLPLFGDRLDPSGLGNTYWLANQPHYEDHQAAYDGARPDDARRALEDAGYTEAADGTYEHPEDGRLWLRVGTTGGDPLRELQQRLIVEQMARAGIEVVIDNVPGDAFFRERPFSPAALACSTTGGAEGDCGIWDIAQFAWDGTPWPGGQSVRYRSGSPNNPYGFANAEFDALAARCDDTVDAADRADCYNRLDRYVTTLELDPVNGLFVLPLTQKPSFFAYNDERLLRAAVAPDSHLAGPLVYAVDYVPAG